MALPLKAMRTGCEDISRCGERRRGEEVDVRAAGM